MIHLKSIILRNDSERPDRFPFNLPMLDAFSELELTEPVTVFVGENGSGKSTLIETIAAGIGSVTVGGESIQKDKTLSHARALSDHFRFEWTKRTRKGFFLRAEDFFQFAKKVKQEQEEYDDMAREFEGKFSGYGLMLARGAALGQKHALEERYEGNPDERSHGESFLQLFQSRLVPGGLYLLDEPEAPLSPQRQLTLLSLVKEMAEEQDAQFIIVTHSPILMAVPGADIISFDTRPLSRIPFDDIEHVNLMRDFLQAPESFLRNL